MLMSERELHECYAPWVRWRLPVRPCLYGRDNCVGPLLPCRLTWAFWLSLAAAVVAAAAAAAAAAYMLIPESDAHCSMVFPWVAALSCCCRFRSGFSIAGCCGYFWHHRQAGTYQCRLRGREVRRVVADHCDHRDHRYHPHGPPGQHCWRSWGLYFSEPVPRFASTKSYSTVPWGPRKEQAHVVLCCYWFCCYCTLPPYFMVWVIYTCEYFFDHHHQVSYTESTLQQYDWHTRLKARAVFAPRILGDLKTDLSIDRSDGCSSAVLVPHVEQYSGSRAAFLPLNHKLLILFPNHARNFLEIFSKFSPASLSSVGWDNHCLCCFTGPWWAGRARRWWGSGEGAVRTGRRRARRGQSCRRCWTCPSRGRRASSSTSWVAMTWAYKRWETKREAGSEGCCITLQLHCWMPLGRWCCSAPNLLVIRPQGLWVVIIWLVRSCIQLPSRGIDLLYHRGRCNGLSGFWFALCGVNLTGQDEAWLSNVFRKLWSLGYVTKFDVRCLVRWLSWW